MSSRASRLNPAPPAIDRKSIRLNSSHGYISYAVFCLKKNDSKFVVAATLDGRRQESRICLAPARDDSVLCAHFGEQIEREDVVWFFFLTRAAPATTPSFSPRPLSAI